jgi:hypothetical protein
VTDTDLQSGDATLSTERTDSGVQIDAIVDAALRFLPIAAIVGYIVGYWALATLAMELGVSVKDLGLDFRDTLVLAGIPAGVWMLGVLLYFSLTSAVNWSDERAKGTQGARRVAFFAIGGIAHMGFSIVGLGIAAITGLNLFAAILLVGLPIIFPGLLRRFPPVGVLAVVAFTLVLAYGVISQMADWATELRAAVAEGDPLPAGPVPARLLLTPSEGTVRVGDEVACVVRLGQDVLIGGTTVVVAEPDLFVAEDCDPDPRPLDP